MVYFAGNQRNVPICDKLACDDYLSGGSLAGLLLLAHPSLQAYVELSEADREDSRWREDG